MVNIEQNIKAFKKWYNEQLSFNHEAKDYFSSIIQALPKVDTVTSRVKNIDECISKFKRKYLPFIDEKHPYYIQDYLTDLIGIRAICYHKDDIEYITRHLKKYFEVVETTDKSGLLDKTEDKFGYKSLHLQLQLKDSYAESNNKLEFTHLIFELQVRTVIQDAWSILDHKIKYKKSIPQNLKRRINRLSALFEIADDEFLSIKNEIAIEEKRIKDKIKKGEAIEKNKKIDVFSFLFIAMRYFPDYEFIEYKVDGFVQEILLLNKNFTEGQLDQALKNQLHIANTIEEKRNQKLNPYTKIRYCLYKSNKEQFQRILSNYQVDMIKKYI